MKILIYTPRFYPSIGGLENMTLMLAREFVKAGNEVKVLCFEDSDNTTCGIEVFYSPSKVLQLSLFRWADVFYMPNISLKGIWLLLTNPFKKWVVSHNGWYGESGLGKRKNVNERFKLLLSRICKNIYVSNAVAEYIGRKGTVIHNCYDDEIFKQTYPGRKNALFVGRLVSDKGIDVLLRSCLSLWRNGATFLLTIVGVGDMKTHLVAFCEKHNVSDKVVFKGMIVGTELAKEMNAHQLLVVPSLVKEGFGIVALEGLACGCTVICSDAGGLPEAVGNFGHIFPARDEQQLSITISTAIDKMQEIDNAQCESFLQQHSPFIVASKYLEIFK